MNKNRQDNLPKFYSGSQTVNRIRSHIFGGENERDEDDNNNEDKEWINKKHGDGTLVEKICNTYIEKRKELL